MYEEKLDERQFRAEAHRREEEHIKSISIGLLLIIISITFCIGWSKYCYENMAGIATPPPSG